MPTLVRRFWLWERPEKLSAFAGDSSKILAARTLHSVLRATLCFGALFLALVVPLFVTKKAAASVFWAVIMFVTAACILLLRRGYVRLSSWIFLSTAWLMLTIFVLLSGGITSPALLSHIAVIVVSAWLVGRRAAIWIAAVSLAFVLSLAVLETVGAHLPQYFPAPPVVAWAIATVLVGLAILPLASVTQALADSASQAQRELQGRRLEERIREESDERFRATFYQAAVGISHIGLDGEWLLFNDRYCQMLDYTPSELRQKTLMEITHPDDREAALAGRGRLLAGEIPSHTMEKRYLRKDQSIFWGSLYRTLVRDRDGAPNYFIGVVEDISERKKAEAALRESEERFRNLADTAPVMVWVSGLDKLCTFFNKPWLDFTGRTMEQELGDGWAAGVHPHDLDRCLATYSSSFDSRRPFQMEYRLRRADGEYRWVLDNAIPHYRDGAFIGYIGSCVDVTEQKLMAEQLRSQQVQLVDAQRLAKFGSWGRDLETGQVEYSDQTFRILGVDGPPPTLSAFLELVHPKDQEKVRESAAEVISSTAPVELSYRIIRADGEVRFLRTIVEAIRDSRGTPVRTVGSMQDITEQVKADQLLRESEERLKSAERLAHVGYWYWDLGTGQVIWSEECLRIFGRPNDYKPTKEEFLQVVAPQDREMVEREIRNVITAKRGNSMEFRIVRPDGELRTVISVSEVLMNEEGSPARMFGAVQDVTDVRRTQEQTIARQKLESLGTLANGIAHDFNNLLGGVLAQAELALSEVAAGLNPEEELRAIRDVAIRGSEIVRELMIYAGKESAVEVLVDVSRIVREMLELLKVSVSKHAVLETNLGPGLPAIRANAAQLRQIVMNLVTNASDAIGDQDGVIRVTTRSVKVGPKSSEVAGRLPAGDYLELEVSDTGRGIPLETQAKVFDPFFTTKSAGHGLGLAIVDGIVRSLGGAVHLASEPDKGTTFRVWLPCAESTGGADPDVASPTRELQGSSQVAAILVVEDEGPLRQAVTKMLRNTGFAVFEAADGTSAINLLRANERKIDLILLDVTIPGASSAEVLAEAAKARPATKVILTSAYSQETLSSPMNAGEASGFIRKPFQLGDLLQTLRYALSL
jgi:two-component system cell cycle sensor histidine kinase/response regulator CckA